MVVICLSSYVKKKCQCDLNSSIAATITPAYQTSISASTVKRIFHTPLLFTYIIKRLYVYGNGIIKIIGMKYLYGYISFNYIRGRGHPWDPWAWAGYFNALTRESGQVA